MNQLLPYEQVIAGKLEQLQVPDLADQIWSAIDQVLQAPQPTPPNPLRRKWRWGIGGGITGVVVVVLLLIGQQRSHKPVQLFHMAPIELPPSLPQQQKQAPPAPRKTDSAFMLLPTTHTQLGKDSVLHRDTTSATNVGVPGIQPRKLPLLDSVKAVPTQKGVRLTDDDYKIKTERKPGS